MAFYAWSPIRYTDDKGKKKEIARGSKVAKGDLPGLSQEDWDAMVEAGSIRQRQVPAPSDYDGSVIEYLRESLVEAQAASPVEEEEAVAELEEVAGQGQ